MSGNPDAPARGSLHRLSDLKEAFQEGYVRAVVASAGCVIGGRPEIDEGIDLYLTHRVPSHLDDGVARLEVQLKATASASNINDEQVSAQISRKRYDYLRVDNPTVPKIVVILALPSAIDDWMISGQEEMLLRHCAYWANLAGSEANDAETITIHASKENVFDDHALCKMMEKIGQGGAP